MAEPENFDWGSGGLEVGKERPRAEAIAPSPLALQLLPTWGGVAPPPLWESRAVDPPFEILGSAPGLVFSGDHIWIVPSGVASVCAARGGRKICRPRGGHRNFERGVPPQVGRRSGGRRPPPPPWSWRFLHGFHNNFRLKGGRSGPDESNKTLIKNAAPLSYATDCANGEISTNGPLMSLRAAGIGGLKRLFTTTNREPRMFLLRFHHTQIVSVSVYQTLRNTIPSEIRAPRQSGYFCMNIKQNWTASNTVATVFFWQCTKSY